MTPDVQSVLLSYANLLLIVATVLYIIYIGWRSPLVGSLASGSAAFGAAGLAISLYVQSLHPENGLASNSVSTMLTLFSLVAVASYLIMEKWYGNRTNGAFVLSVVAVVAIFQAFGGTVQPIYAANEVGVLQKAAVRMFVLFNFIFIGAVILASGSAALYLWQARFRPLMFAQTAGGGLEKKIVIAMSLGFVLYTLAQILTIGFPVNVFIDDWAYYLHAIKLIALWWFLLFFQVVYRQLRWRGPIVAWWAIAGLFLSLFVLPDLRAAWSI